jgi:hypothetical protein
MGRDKCLVEFKLVLEVLKRILRDTNLFEGNFCLANIFVIKESLRGSGVAGTLDSVQYPLHIGKKLIAVSKSVSSS